MGEAKPTPGPWWLDEYGNLRCGVPVYRDRVLITGISIPNGNSKDYEEAKANRDLLFDAGTVFHTTGLTPSQLVERVKELEEAAKLVLDWYEAENDHSKTDFYQRMQMCRDSEDAIRSALSRACPNTAEPQGVAYAELPQADSWVHFYPQFGEAKLRVFADRTHALRASVTTNACGEPVAHSELFEYLRGELSAIPCRYRGDPSYDHDAYWMRDKVEKLIDEAERIFPAASIAASEPVAPEDYVPMLDDEGRVMVGASHHYTAENIRALVEEYKALEAGAPEALERYSNSDHRTRAGVLWRVISALADEVPLAAAKEPSP